MVSKLNPTLAFANAATCLPYEDYKWQFNEFDALQRFYCLMPFRRDYFSIDKLGAFINGANWITCLNEVHIAQLGGLDNVKNALHHESIKITNIGDNCLIKIGEYPNIAPITEGIPPLYKMVSDFLRPIRVESLGSLHNGSLNGSINFDPRTTDLWLRRFDEPGIWPPYPDNIQFYGLGEADEVDAEETVEMIDLLKQRVPANNPCPQSGYWYTPAKQNSRTLFRSSELMPDFPASTYGATIWYWDANQE
nr:type VI immunity family protein [Iodobacter ciconiae]